MTRYLLDTNTVSALLREHVAVAQHVLAVPMASLCISVITEAELLFGLAKRPAMKRLHAAVRELLRRVDVLSWDSRVAERYAMMRADLERLGKPLGSLDLLIAAHALSLQMVLVTSDKAFKQVEGLQVQDWTVDVVPR